ncbi:peptidoglycan-binding domain-containing protein [Streptomyces sp. 8N616]|uniref:peptidoglycan-binding domain-containing protein n=1 Tax=Streptomyces sp. 8N616 TaxID=3457414 RepID=UPI003FD5A662
MSGFILASALLGNDRPALPVSSTPIAQPDRPLSDNPSPSVPENPQLGNPQLGGGVLRRGDSGHGVYELQVRLLQVPNLYGDRDIDGLYDIEVQEAVARFQEWYGIRGDERGVYGDNTRRDLESRTK